MKARLFSIIFGAALSHALIALTGCQTIGARPGETSFVFGTAAGGKKDGAISNSVTGIKTTSEKDKSLIVIQATAPFDYSSYKLESPLRLAVELSGVTHHMKRPMIPVREGLLDRIHFVSFDRAGKLRVEIGVNALFQYDIKKSGSSIHITIARDNSPEALALEAAKKKIDELTEENKSLRMKLAEQDAAKEEKQAPMIPVVDETEAIINTIARWKGAWEAKDLAAFREFYTPVFEIEGQSTEEWLADKQKKFRRSKDIKIDVADISVKADGDKAAVEFIQKYTSGRYSDTGVKTMAMVKTENGWKIESEKFKPNQ
ncbi:MAG: nuclear transport factor 2 family protein [Nitrospinae bacterium]|nr:nuclear transport factor 2 family protein [Nitrospinota bacterium]